MEEYTLSEIFSMTFGVGMQASGLGVIFLERANDLALLIGIAGILYGQSIYTRAVMQHGHREQTESHREQTERMNQLEETIKNYTKTG